MHQLQRTLDGQTGDLGAKPATKQNHDDGEQFREKIGGLSPELVHRRKKNINLVLHVRSLVCRARSWLDGTAGAIRLRIDKQERHFGANAACPQSSWRIIQEYG